MALTDKIKTAVWYLADPERRAAFIPTLLYRVAPHPKEWSGDAALRLCETQALSAKAAVERLAPGHDHVVVEQEYPDVFGPARARCEACPVRMGGPGDLDLIYNLAESINARTAVETGVAYGWSSLALLLSLKRRAGRLISTDMPYAKAGNEPYVGVAIPDDLKPFWTLIRKPDRAGLPQALAAAGPIDICHYDSDKSYAGRRFAYPRLWAALRPGGVFMSDDVSDNLAFHEFAAEMKCEPTIVACDAKFVGVIRK
jgi:predicted O-methyltransferase YrrM